jgi:hypothetical protein
MNSGRFHYKHISYDVKYKGKPLQFSNKLEVNTGLPGIWRVFFVQDAPKPTLILGSQSLYLVTEENDHAEIKVLCEQNSDFASIQWLDSEMGQPGILREVFSSDELDTSTMLSEGRFIAVSRAAVFDTKTLDIYPFNTNNDPIDGFNLFQSRVIAFSPDSSQLVYCGSKNNEQDYEKYDYAMIVYNFKDSTSYSVPFNLEDFKLKDAFNIPNELFTDYFEWVKADTNKLHLQLRKLEKPPFRKGWLVYERWPGYKYVLDPVDEPMMEIFADFISQKIDMKKEDMVHDKQEYSNKINFTYQGEPYIIQYGEYGQDLVLKQETNLKSVEGNKAFITDIGKGFNALLSQGQYQEHFVPPATAD